MIFPILCIVLQIAVERSVYSVVEGEYLDVCVIVTRGTVIFSFSVSVYLITPSKTYTITVCQLLIFDDHGTHMHLILSLCTVFSIHESIRITVGVTIACTQLHIPDLGSFLEYFTFKEYLLQFSLELPELIDTVSLQTNQSWLHIIDNDSKCIH